jgi:hypothetical protein
MLKIQKFEEFYSCKQIKAEIVNKLGVVHKELVDTVRDRQIKLLVKAELANLYEDKPETQKEYASNINLFSLFSVSKNSNVIRQEKQSAAYDKGRCALM